MRLPGCPADLGIPDMTLAEARRQGAGPWWSASSTRAASCPSIGSRTIVEAIEAGLDVASGLHDAPRPVPAIARGRRPARRAAARRAPCRRAFATGKGTRRPGKRMLTVGTDCSVGKKYTALALEQEMRARGFDAEFCATGQTGVLIAGRGVAIDAVAADFISGAVEWIAPAPSRTTGSCRGPGLALPPSFAGVTSGCCTARSRTLFVRLPRADADDDARAWRTAAAAIRRGHRPHACSSAR